MDKQSSKLWISNDALKTMQILAQSKYPLETGGMLLGYVACNGESVVAEIIGPGPKAKHGRYRFTPDGEYQQSILERHFRETNGSETYLGDWHTHPGGKAIPSYLDKKTLGRIALEPSSGILHPVMAILGGGNKSWTLGAVRFNAIERRLMFNNYQVEMLTPVYF